MTVQAYLEQGRFLEKEIRYHAMKREELRAAACSVSSPRFDKDRVLSSPAGEALFVRMLERVEEMEQRMDREIALLTELKEQIEGVIRQLDDAGYRLVMLYRYLEGMSWAEIGDRLEIARCTAKRWHAQALLEMTLPENPICIHPVI